MRNGKIELMRFFFCIGVFMCHITSDLGIRTHEIVNGITFFQHGRNGVEFFLLLSGFFCARSAYKAKSSKNSIGIDTYEFMKKKIYTILPFYMMFCAIMLVLFYWYDKNPSNKIIDYIPTILMLQRTGIYSKDIISVAWYIPSMLFALAVVYPLLRKSFDFAAYVLSPVAGSLMIGYFIYTGKELPSSGAFGEYIYLCNLRALAIVLLGVFAYVMSQRLREAQLPKRKWIVLILIENLCWLFSIYYTFSNLSNKYDGLFVYSTMIAVTICLSRNLKPVYQNKFFMYLGRLSLPLYLGQNVIRTIYSCEGIELKVRYAIPLMLAGAIITGVLAMLVTDLYKKLKTKRESKLIANNA